MTWRAASMLPAEMAKPEPACFTMQIHSDKYPRAVPFADSPPPFNLVAAATEWREEFQNAVDQGAKLTWYNLHGAPAYVTANIKRLLASSNRRLSLEDGFNAVVQAGLGRVLSYPATDLFINLSKAANSEEQGYQDTEDWDFVISYCEDFRFTIDPLSTRQRKRNFRTLPSLKAEINSTAELLGLLPSTFAQVLIIDTLRRCEGGVIHREDLGEIVYGFYRKLRKRTRLLAAVLGTFDGELTKQTKKYVHLVEEKLSPPRRKVTTAKTVADRPDRTSYK